MIIKTITCHDVNNIGASLQAYALQNYLQSLKNDVQIINYKPYYQRYRFWGCSSPKYNKPLIRTIYSLIKFPVRLAGKYSKRKREYRKFNKKYLNLTRIYTSNDELKVNPPLADIYFAGSDQIWNTFFPNGKDPAFYLDFAPGKSIKASYAASFSLDHVEPSWENQISEWLKKLDYISVRELQGLNILKELGVEGGCNVLDPVFLLNKAKWLELSNQWNNPIKKPYVLVYSFDDDGRMAQKAKQLAKEKNCEVISVLKTPFIKRSFYKEGPIAFLSLINNAEYIISNSFHATAFSLIFEKEFLIYNRKEGVNSRIRDILQLVGLENRLGTNQALEKINYKEINRKLFLLIKQSKDFIGKVISKKGV